MEKKNIVVVGAGKGMGNHIAKKFGENGYRVILMSRNQESLDSYMKDFEIYGIEAYGIAADASDTDSLTRGFEEIFSRFGAIDTLAYNAAILEAGKPTELSSDELVRHYQVASALHCVKLALSGMRENKGGTVLFTGGGLAINPVADFTCVSMDKAALRALAFTLNQELKAENIFVGIVTIQGNITPGTEYDPELIAEKYWQLFTERKDSEIIY